ncbi:hypothetical protein Lesp02_24450 [Lentzea sp. NBRC 105346]|uniref:hypothetical protein n=1 Tax=Lentzea sp. NBRC 105346 TaxID=3032205 RepID=UPI00249FF30D|nr:hypothetical protein [Lentzea sp. NBRC 105346]GLZ30255.1 hypothetical protein Lesp02_24450 [Lentzea sp. NBRC 105346]
MGGARRLSLLMLTCLAACSTVEGSPTGVPTTTTTPPVVTTTAPSTTTIPPTTPVPPTTTTAVGQQSAGWTITVYYTAVESFHSGERKRVRGCPKIDCANGSDDLGSYPADFVEAVESEGTGRTASGKYLNWSHDSGFWLDTAPRDTNGGVLEPFVSAAADGLPKGARVKIVSCGQTDVCAKFRSASWVIKDSFTPGLGGTKHIDLYLGEENGPRFTESAWYTTFTQAVLLIG